MKHRLGLLFMAACVLTTSLACAPMLNVSQYQVALGTYYDALELESGSDGRLKRLEEARAAADNGVRERSSEPEPRLLRATIVLAQYRDQVKRASGNQGMLVSFGRQLVTDVTVAMRIARDRGQDMLLSRSHLLLGQAMVVMAVTAADADPSGETSCRMLTRTFARLAFAEVMGAHFARAQMLAIALKPPLESQKTALLDAARTPDANDEARLAQVQTDLRQIDGLIRETRLGLENALSLQANQMAWSRQQAGVTLRAQTPGRTLENVLEDLKVLRGAAAEESRAWENAKKNGPDALLDETNPDVLIRQAQLYETLAAPPSTTPALENINGLRRALWYARLAMFLERPTQVGLDPAKGDYLFEVADKLTLLMLEEKYGQAANPCAT
jgi:hypothetical protein